MGEILSEPEARRIDEEITAEAVLNRIYLLHEYRMRARAPVLDVVGTEHIDAALRQGRGAILWVTPLCHSDLMTKRAIHEAGYRVHHLSRPEHGGGSTRFGMRFLSPIYQTIENRFLESRLLLRDAGTAALRELVTKLQANVLVSIAVLETAAQTVQVPFLETSISLARGPVALASRSGAALLPVFALRLGFDRFQTVVLPPLIVEGAGILLPFEQYARALEERVRVSALTRKRVNLDRAHSAFVGRRAFCERSASRSR